MKEIRKLLSMPSMARLARSEFGHILQDIKSLISSFCSVSFSHVKRQDNCLAHCLARRAISISLDV